MKCKRLSLIWSKRLETFPLTSRFVLFGPIVFCFRKVIGSLLTIHQDKVTEIETLEGELSQIKEERQKQSQIQGLPLFLTLFFLFFFFFFFFF